MRRARTRVFSSSFVFLNIMRILPGIRLRVLVWWTSPRGRSYENVYLITIHCVYVYDTRTRVVNPYDTISSSPRIQSVQIHSFFPRNPYVFFTIRAYRVAVKGKRHAYRSLEFIFYSKISL